VHSRSANATIQCPISAGEHKVVHTVALPKEIPRGMLNRSTIEHHLLTYSSIAKFAVEARGSSVNDEDLMCVKINIDFILGHN
jgi:hypothetical protein